MNLRTNLMLPLALVTLSSTMAWANNEHLFPEVGKTYVMHRYNDQNSYIYENANALFAGAKMNTQKQYWQFIPTQKANCYYIQNVTTKRYIQSSSQAADIQVKTGTTPVEFEIKKNTTSGAAPNGYYYMCSTDQTIDTSKDGTLGLNYQQSTGKVVAYHIRYNRSNSYWDINETDYDYEAPAPIERSEYSKRLGIYMLPCGNKGTAYLKSLSITKAHKPLHYAAAAQPSNYYNMVRSDSAVVFEGSTFELSYETSGLTADYTVSVYFDWNKDGIFEERQDFLSNAEGKAEITLPTTAVLGRSRMRVRITDNSLEEADDDVNGMVYDFQLFTIKSPEDITQIDQVDTSTAPVQSNNIYSIDGRHINNLTTHKGAYIQAHKKRIK